jgi:hypothetical protein
MGGNLIVTLAVRAAPERGDLRGHGALPALLTDRGRVS